MDPPDEDNPFHVNRQPKPIRKMLAREMMNQTASPMEIEKRHLGKNNFPYTETKIHMILCIDVETTTPATAESIIDFLKWHYSLEKILKSSISVVFYSNACYNENSSVHKYIRWYPLLSQDDFEQVFNYNLDDSPKFIPNLKHHKRSIHFTDNGLSNFIVKFSQKLHIAIFNHDPDVMVNISVFTELGCNDVNTLLNEKRHIVMAECKLMKILTNDVSNINNLKNLPHTKSLTVVYMNNEHAKNLYDKFETSNFKSRKIDTNEKVKNVMMNALYSTFLRSPVHSNFSNIDKDKLYTITGLVDRTRSVSGKDLFKVVNAANFNTLPSYFGWHSNNWRESITKKLIDDIVAADILCSMLIKEFTHMEYYGVISELYKLVFDLSQYKIPVARHSVIYSTTPFMMQFSRDVRIGLCNDMMLCKDCYEADTADSIGLFAVVTKRSSFTKNLKKLEFRNRQDIQEVGKCMNSIKIQSSKPDVHCRQFRVISNRPNSFKSMISLFSTEKTHANLNTLECINTERRIQMFKWVIGMSQCHEVLQNDTEINYEMMVNFKANDMRIYNDTYVDLLTDNNCPSPIKFLIFQILMANKTKSQKYLHERCKVHESSTYLKQLRQETRNRMHYCNYCKHDHLDTSFYNVNHLRKVENVQGVRDLCRNVLRITSDFNPEDEKICVFQLFNDPDNKNKECKKLRRDHCIRFFKCVTCKCMYPVQRNYHLNHGMVAPKCPSCSNKILNKNIFKCKYHGNVWNGFYKYYKQTCSICPIPIVECETIKVPKAKRIDAMTDNQIKRYTEQIYGRIPEHVNIRAVWEEAKNLPNNKLWSNLGASEKFPLYLNNTNQFTPAWSV
ncbi:hypothetical protein CsNV_094 [Callinectes sapidus nudivirus]|nr:hypothetical protein CsNV_094 [Callinectes sapidus nudivirus]